jgi:hypothetical protein
MEANDVTQETPPSTWSGLGFASVGQDHCGSLILSRKPEVGPAVLMTFSTMAANVNKM